MKGKNVNNLIILNNSDNKNGSQVISLPSNDKLLYPLATALRKHIWYLFIALGKFLLINLYNSYSSVEPLVLVRFEVFLIKKHIKF